MTYFNINNLYDCKISLDCVSVESVMITIGDPKPRKQNFDSVVKKKKSFFLSY